MTDWNQKQIWNKLCEIATKFQLLYLCFWNWEIWLHLCKYCQGEWVVCQRWVVCNRKLPNIYHKPWRGRVFGLVQLYDAWLQQHRYSRWNFVAISYTNWDVLSYPLPSTGVHLWILIHPDKRQCLDQSSRVAWHRKHKYNRWNFVALTYTSWDIRYSI